MAIQRSTSMNRMWNDFRETFPESDRESDGWIGDLAHATGSSGHNPDDTVLPAGGSAERQDADTKQEVRAIDKDKDLRSPKGYTLEQVIQRMLKTPADLTRLIYIIYKRRIWRKSEGWVQKPYTGDSAHDEHAHFSGDPASDENGAEWKSITSFKEANMGNDFTNTDPNAWAQARRIESIHQNLPQTNADTGSEPNGLASALAGIASQSSSNGSGISEIKTAVAALAAGGVTQEMLNVAVAQALTNPVVLAALANAINDDAARRLAE